MMGVRSTGPTRVFADAAGGFSVFLFGRNTGSWRTGDEEAQRLMLEYAALHGAHTLFALRPTEFNGRIDTRESFKTIRTHTFRGTEIELRLGTTAEGINELQLGEAFWIASADCPTVVLSSGSQTVVFHAGLRSLVGKHGGVWMPGWQRPSVVSNALAQIEHPFFEARARIICGTDRLMYRLDDRVHGAGNRQLRDILRRSWGDVTLPVLQDDGGILLKHLICAHLIAGGVSRERIQEDLIDTQTQRAGDGEFVWHSNARDGVAAGRNGVLVVKK